MNQWSFGPIRTEALFLYDFYQLTSVYTDDILCISDIYNIQADIGIVWFGGWLWITKMQ